MGGDDRDEPIFDADYLRMLLTEVRPDVTLEEFREYANLPEGVLARLLSEVQDRGDAAIYADGFNEPVVCLTPLGAERSGVKLSEWHPPIWVSVHSDVPPPSVAARDDGMVAFTDLEAESPETGDPIAFADSRPDPAQREPVEVLVDVEAFAETLLSDGRRHPGHRQFALLGLHEAWPIGRGDPRGKRGTPSASTWQELYTVCPFCLTLPEGEACRMCGGLAPAKPCPECTGKALTFVDYCLWCGRSGVDHLLPRAEVPTVRRKHHRRPLRGGRK